MPKTAIPRVPSVADLRVVRNAVIEAADAFRRNRDGLAAVRARAQREAEANADDLAKFGQFDRRAMVRENVTKATKAYLAERADTFGRAQKDIAGSLNVVEHGKALYGNKRALLNALTLGDPNRATYAANLASAGPAAIMSAASFALANKDAALAAAVAAVVDAMPVKERPLTVAELVADLEHDQIDGTMTLFAELDRLVVVAQVEASGVLDPDGGRSADKIRLGLEQRRVGLTDNDATEPSPALDAATAKISRGLAARKAAGKPTASDGEASDAAAA